MAELLLEQFAPEFKALRPEDEKLVEKLNATMEYYLSGSNIHVKITDAIRNACEFGTGIITVGVNGTQVHGPRGAEETGMVAAKVWSPFK